MKTILYYSVIIFFFFCTCFKRPGLGFQFYAIVYIFVHSVSLKLYSKSWSHHSPQKFLKMSPVTRFLHHVLQTSRIRVSKLGFRFYALFYYFIHSVSSTFFSKSSSQIIPLKNFEKRRSLHGFFRTCFKRPLFGFRL